MLRARLVPGVAVVCLVTACAGGTVPTACPAIGWSSTLAVQAPTTADGSSVELCVGSDCATPADLAAGFPASGPFEAALRVDGGWEFSLLGTPETVRVRTLDATGGVLSDRTVRPDWVRTGGSEECGGPQRAVVTP